MWSLSIEFVRKIPLSGLIYVPKSSWRAGPSSDFEVFLALEPKLQLFQCDSVFGLNRVE